jgi:uncharacterized protein YbcI
MAPSERQGWLPGAVRAEITREIIELYSRRLGRGPARGRTHADGDTVVCMLRGTLLPFEQDLLAAGKGDLIWEVRVHFRRAIRTELIEIVERHSGRKVECMLSDFDPERALTALVFVLETQPG